MAAARTPPAAGEGGAHGRSGSGLDAACAEPLAPAPGSALCPCSFLSSFSTDASSCPPQGLLPRSLQLNGLWVRSWRDTLGVPRSQWDAAPYPGRQCLVSSSLVFGKGCCFPGTAVSCSNGLADPAQKRSQVHELQRKMLSSRQLALRYMRPSSVSQACQDRKSP